MLDLIDFHQKKFFDTNEMGFHCRKNKDTKPVSHKWLGRRDQNGTLTKVVEMGKDHC